MAPPQVCHQPILEDEDDWLNGYLATTKYSNDERIMSKPVKQVKQAKQPKPSKDEKEKNSQKRRYSLHARVSRSSSGATAGGHVSALPDRVKSIRDGSRDRGSEGHFVRDYRMTRPSMSGRRMSVSRRDSIDIDALEAMRLRLSQVTSAYASKHDMKPAKKD